MARGDLNAGILGRSRGGAVADRDVEAAVKRVLVNVYGVSERLMLDLQELAGQRGAGGRPREAVRRGDLSALTQVPELSSKPLTSAPTAADYNALRDDVRRLFEAITTIARAVR